MPTGVEERRMFPRRSVNGGMMFVDNTSVCGLARVVNISRGGVKCVTLRQIGCPISWLEGIELHEHGRELVVRGLRGRMVHCSDNSIGVMFLPAGCCYIFGIEFAEEHRYYLEKLLSS